jgi:cell division protein FtsB
MRSLRAWLWRLAAAGVIAGALAYVPYRVYGSQGYVHYRKLARDVREIEKANAALRAENARLAHEVDRLSADSNAIGRVARDELGMVAPNEMVFQIDRPVPAPPEPAPAAPAPPSEPTP